MLLRTGDRRLLIGRQRAVNAEGQGVGKGHLGKHTRQVLQNLKACLVAAGATLEQLVQVKSYLEGGTGMRASSTRCASTLSLLAIAAVRTGDIICHDTLKRGLHNAHLP